MSRSSRMPQIIAGLAVSFLALLLALSSLPEQQEAALLAPRLTPASRPRPSATPISLILTAQNSEVRLRLEVDDQQPLSGTVLRVKLIIENVSEKSIKVISVRARFQAADGRDQAGDLVFALDTLSDGQALSDKLLRPRSSWVVERHAYVPTAINWDEPLPLLWGEVNYTTDIISFEHMGRLDVGPLALKIRLPAAAEQLLTRLSTNSEGWRLQVELPDGRPPPAELEGVAEVQTTFGSLYIEHETINAGWWAKAWRLHDQEQPMELRALAILPGYSAEVVTQTLAVTTTNRRWQSERLSFATVEEAQQLFDEPLVSFTPGAGKLALRLETLEVLSTTYGLQGSKRIDHTRQANLHYITADGSWLVLEQYAHDGAFQPLANTEPIALGQQTAYAGRLLGTRLLYWEGSTMALTLKASASAFSKEQLVELAALIQ